MKIYYNSKIAKWLTFIEGFSTIMLFGAVFTEKSELSERTIQHERVHVEQYRECFAIGLVIAFAMVFVVGYSAWIIALPLIPITSFYTAYGLEVFISFIVNLIKKRGKIRERAYYYSALEQEARYWQDEYLKPCEARRWRKSFGWFRFYGKM